MIDCHLVILFFANYTFVTIAAHINYKNISKNTLRK